MTKRGHATLVMMAALVAVGMTRVESPQMVSVPSPPEKQLVPVVHEKTVIKYVNVAKQPSGLMTRDQCLSIEEGTSFRDILFIYGWPAKDDGDSSAGYLTYPLVENHDNRCVVDFYNSKVNETRLDEAMT